MDAFSAVFSCPEPPFHHHPRHDFHDSSDAAVSLRDVCSDTNSLIHAGRSSNCCALGLRATTRDQVDRLLTDLDRPSCTSPRHNQPQLAHNSLHGDQQRRFSPFLLSQNSSLSFTCTGLPLSASISTVYVACPRTLNVRFKQQNGSQRSHVGRATIC